MTTEKTQITLEKATLEIIERIREKTDQTYSEKWKGNTAMIFGMAMKVIMLKAFDLEAALPPKYNEFQQPIEKNFSKELSELEDLIMEGSRQFIKLGLQPQQAIAETKVQIFNASATVLPEGVAQDIMQMVNN